MPFQIPSLWWMQAAAGSCYLTFSLGLFVFGFQLSYRDVCVLCIPWHVRLDQTTACHTEQQIKAVWVSCRYISPGIGKFRKLSLVENILVCSKHPLDHVSFSLGWLEFFFMCTVWNLKKVIMLFRGACLNLCLCCSCCSLSRLIVKVVIAKLFQLIFVLLLILHYYEELL